MRAQHLYFVRAPVKPSGVRTQYARAVGHESRAAPRIRHAPEDARDFSRASPVEEARAEMAAPMPDCKRTCRIGGWTENNFLSPGGNNPHGQSFRKKRSAMRYFLLFVVLFSAYMEFACAQPIVRGRIFDSTDRSALSYAAVGIEGKRVGVLTDSSGNFA